MHVIEESEWENRGGRTRSRDGDYLLTDIPRPRTVEAIKLNEQLYGRSCDGRNGRAWFSTRLKMFGS